jgi:hypothetical protein
MRSSRKGLTVEETIAELHSDPFSDVSDLESSDAETVDSSDIEHSSVDISDSEISEQSDTATVDGWIKHDKTPNSEPYLGNQSVNVAIGNPSDITQLVSMVTGDDLLQLFAKQSYLYHKQNVDKLRTSLKSLKWTDITSTETKKFLGLILLMGQV